MDMRWPPSDLRFLLVLMIACGVSRDRPPAMFRDHLPDVGDRKDEVNWRSDGLIAAQGQEMAIVPGKSTKRLPGDG